MIFTAVKPDKRLDCGFGVKDTIVTSAGRIAHISFTGNGEARAYQHATPQGRFRFSDQDRNQQFEIMRLGDQFIFRHHDQRVVVGNDSSDGAPLYVHCTLYDSDTLAIDVELLDYDPVIR